jgi:hypothetical protein
MMNVLPKQFAELEPLSHWAGSSEAERVERRRASSPEELKSFYDIMKPQVVPVLKYLDEFPLNDMPAAEEKLLHLTLMMAEVAFAVEKYDAVGVVPLGIAPEQLTPIHDTK